MESLHASLLASINGEKCHQYNKVLDNLVNETSKLNKDVQGCIKGNICLIDMTIFFLYYHHF